MRVTSGAAVSMPVSLSFEPLPFSTKARTSCATMRLCGPVPWMQVSEIPCSRAIRRARGVARINPSTPGGGKFSDKTLAFVSGGAVDPAAAGDRKSVVEGKSVSVRVVLGGRRIIKKKKYEVNYKKNREHIR